MLFKDNCKYRIRINHLTSNRIMDNFNYSAKPNPGKFMKRYKRFMKYVEDHI